VAAAPGLEVQVVPAAVAAAQAQVVQIHRQLREVLEQPTLVVVVAVVLAGLQLRQQVVLVVLE